MKENAVNHFNKNFDANENYMQFDNFVIKALHKKYNI